MGGVAVNYAGNQPQNVPERVSNLSLTLALPHWEAQARVQIVGETFGGFANTAERPSYTVQRRPRLPAHADLTVQRAGLRPPGRGLSDHRQLDDVDAGAAPFHRAYSTAY